MSRELVIEPKRRAGGLRFEHGLQQIKQAAVQLTGTMRAWREALAHKIETGSAQQIARRCESRREHRQQSFVATSFETAEQACHTPPSDRHAEVAGGRVFQMMSLVNDDALIARQHRGIIPVVCGTTYGHVGEQQMMIDHHHISQRRESSRVEEETLVIVRAFESSAQIRLR